MGSSSSSLQITQEQVEEFAFKLNKESPEILKSHILSVNDVQMEILLKIENERKRALALYMGLKVFYNQDIHVLEMTFSGPRSLEELKYIIELMSIYPDLRFDAVYFVSAFDFVKVLDQVEYLRLVELFIKLNPGLKDMYIDSYFSLEGVTSILSSLKGSQYFESLTLHASVRLSDLDYEFLKDFVKNVQTLEDIRIDVFGDSIISPNKIISTPESDKVYVSYQNINIVLWNIIQKRRFENTGSVKPMICEMNSDKAVDVILKCMEPLSLEDMEYVMFRVDMGMEDLTDIGIIKFFNFVSKRELNIFDVNLYDVNMSTEAKKLLIGFITSYHKIDQFEMSEDVNFTIEDFEYLESRVLPDTGARVLKLGRVNGDLYEDHERFVDVLCKILRKTTEKFIIMYMNVFWEEELRERIQKAIEERGVDINKSRLSFALKTRI